MRGEWKTGACLVEGVRNGEISKACQKSKRWKLTLRDRRERERERGEERRELTERLANEISSPREGRTAT